MGIISDILPQRKGKYTIMARICFYISSHGFGHATREIEVISQIPPAIDVEIITAVPRWLFEKSLVRPFDYTEFNHDCGIIQPDSFTQNLPATYARWCALLDQYPQFAEDEAARLRSHDVRAVVGDISPLAIAVAARLGVPSYLVANFGWDWIFQVFVEEMPAMQSVIDRIAEYYHQTDCLLQTPLSGPMTAFPHVQPVPLIVRRSHKTRDEARRGFGLDPQAKVVLISFGGMGGRSLAPDGLLSMEDILFLTFDPTLVRFPNVRFLDPQTTYHPDAIQACDIAMTKLGYGIVTECIAHQTPILYPPREKFPEYQVLEAEAGRYIPLIQLSNHAFFTGQWGALRHVLARPALSLEPTPRIDGGKVAAQILLDAVGG
jgi:hypothetical protein